MMHGADSKVNRQKSYLKKWIANTLWFNRFMRNAASIIYLSRTELENCLSAGNNSHNIIIPNGCDRGEYVENKNKIHNPVNIIFLGRLAKFHKGIDVLLDAIELLKKQSYREVKIKFYANENDVDLQYLKNRLPSISTLAEYCGGVYGEQKVQVLKNADAFILTSRFEGMPMGVLEALSYGVPCILTPGTNMADDLQQKGAGWQTDFDAISISQRIVDAVEDLKHNYNDFHNAAFALSSNYDWKKIALRHVDLMREIAKCKSS